MINATTHQGAEGVLRTEVRPVHYISSRALAVLMGIELALLFGVLAWALVWLMPTNTPFASPQDLTPVVEMVRGSLSGSINDPLIDVEPGLSVPASNVRGLTLGNSVYYYYVEGQINFDPLSRGLISQDSVEVMLRDTDGSRSFVIYRLR